VPTRAFGAAAKRKRIASMRFAILEHDHPLLHWDLLLEADGVLKAWRLAQPPEPNHRLIDATALPDHRLRYLDYEGPVGGGRGQVKRWESGDYFEEADSTPQRRRLRFAGTRWHLSIQLTHHQDDQWQWELVTAS
jgi:hypothetical protein